MYQEGNYVVYGSYGVCLVERIGTLESIGMPKDKVYYTLRPAYGYGNTIYTPVDSQKVILRPVMTREEVIRLIDDIKNVDALWIMDEHKREAEYREAFRKCDCRELIKIIKTIYSRNQLRLAEGKKITSGDEKYFRMAEDSLYSEFSIPLDMDVKMVKEYVIARVTAV